MFYQIFFLNLFQVHIEKLVLLHYKFYIKWQEEQYMENEQFLILFLELLFFFDSLVRKLVWQKQMELKLEDPVWFPVLPLTL